MSCSILSNEQLSCIASTIYAVDKFGFNNFGFYSNYHLTRAIAGKSEREVFELVANMNMLAYVKRYNKEITTAATFIDAKYTYPLKYYQGQAVIEKWHLELYMVLKEYLYNCAEDSSIQSSDLFLGIKELQVGLADFIASYVKIDKGA